MHRKKKILNSPKTLEEAQAYRYGKWAGNPKGHSCKREYCACQVFPQLGEHYQCQRKKGYGPNMLYCKQHAKILAREEKYSIKNFLPST